MPKSLHPTCWSLVRPIKCPRIPDPSRPWCTELKLPQDHLKIFKWILREIPILKNKSPYHSTNWYIRNCGQFLGNSFSFLSMDTIAVKLDFQFPKSENFHQRKWLIEALVSSLAIMALGNISLNFLAVNQAVKRQLLTSTKLAPMQQEQLAAKPKNQNRNRLYTIRKRRGLLT